MPPLLRRFLALTTLAAITLPLAADVPAPHGRTDLALGAYVAMSDLAYINAKDLRALMATPANEACRALSELRRYAKDITLIPEAEQAAIAGLDEFSTETPPCAILFRGPGALHVLAFRGSDAVLDWLINAAGFVGIVPDYYVRAERLVDAAKQYVENRGGTLVLTGHSLGGGMAEYAAAKHGLVAYTFNSAHLSQPFEPDPDALISTFHVTGPRWWNATPLGDIVNALRVGGNFEQTRLISARLGRWRQIPIYGPHQISRFYDWKEDPTSPISRTQHSRANFENPQLHRSELLRGMPNLVAEPPALLRDAVRRHDVNDCPAFENAENNQLADVWDFRFRSALLSDSHPSGGLPVESLRVLDPAKNESGADDTARLWAYQCSVSHPYTKSLALLGNLGHRSIDYQREDTHDFSITEGALGFAFRREPSARAHLRQLPEHTFAVAGTFKRFKADNANAGAAVGLQLATALRLGRHAFVWEDVTISRLTHTRVAGAGGRFTDATAGIRGFLAQTEHADVVWQARGFHGQRIADNPQFHSKQWGWGLGGGMRLDLHSKDHDDDGNSMHVERVRLFVERAMSWSDRNIIQTGRLSDIFSSVGDRELIVRIEINAELYMGYRQWQLVGWEIGLAHTYARTRTKAGIGDYKRRILGVHLNKQF